MRPGRTSFYLEIGQTRETKYSLTHETGEDLTITCLDKGTELVEIRNFYETGHFFISCGEKTRDQWDDRD